MARQEGLLRARAVPGHQHRYRQEDAGNVRIPGRLRAGSGTSTWWSCECPPIEAIDPSLPPATRSAARKTAALKQVIAERGFDGIIAGIRRDEEGTRAKERVFSPRGEGGGWDYRDQPPEFWDQFNTEHPPGTHLRVHPLLDWTELDIWRYIERERIPIVDLYFAKDGKRYRSLGDKDITFPVASTAATLAEIIAELESTKVAERSGRAMDHESEDSFERLRSAGYM